MKFCYLLGYPVEHSMSAIMHNAAFESLNLDFKYGLRSVLPDELLRFVEEELRKPEVRGGNVTIPHKEAIMRGLDEIDTTAERIGAVNTIVNDEGWLKGYNTDVTGICRALNESYGTLSNVKATVLGAGGAAKAVTYHLSKEASKISILNRSPLKAKKLAEYLSNLPECKATIYSMPLKNEYLEEALIDADILVNATPVGMYPNIYETLVDEELLRPDLFVFDIVYNPLKTRLMIEAERRGAATLGGASMLVFQGAHGFKLWTGKEPPEELMLRAVKRALGERVK